MRRTFFSLILFFIISVGVHSQDLSYSNPGSTYYHELSDPSPTVIEDWLKLGKDCYVSFADDNVRYSKKTIPDVIVEDTWEVTAWRGEKVHTQILVWTKKAIPKLSFEVMKLENENGFQISQDRIKPAFVRYVMADEFGGGCTKRKASELDSSLVADPIDIIYNIPVEPYTVQPLWLSISVPSDIPSGTYNGTIIINTEDKYILKIALNVLNHILPSPDKWEFDLDLWQSADPIAKIHDVELWSDAHYDLMRPYFTTLANAGQKVISANIINQPWGNDHVYFDDPTLIKWTKKKNGAWKFDYGQFDKYISFVMSCGIKQRINCYSMVTWDLSFSYYDEALGEEVTFKTDLASKEYEEFWMRMLKDFTNHLKLKGWFGITSIAVDERSLESMQIVISILKRIDPEWKIALAADKHYPEINREIYDYSIASYLKIEDDVMVWRKENDMPTTFYTACVETHLAPYTFTPPAENAWIGWFASAKGYTGYLFWAYNQWVKDPLRDSRFYQWPSGTCYQFYPGPRTSIRFEKLIEGIQDFEKIRLLREEFIKNDKYNDIRKLDEILSAFQLEILDSVSAADILVKAKEQLNKF